jgi:broad specificity phosphatase PhoE
MTDVMARMNAFLSRLHGEAPAANIALFSHGDAIRAALCYYLSAPIDHLPRIEIQPASVSILSLGPTGPMVKGVNKGIWVLLGLVGFVQIGFVALFWSFWRRAREQRRFRESLHVIEGGPVS